MLSGEMKEICNEIAVMKLKKNRMTDGPEKVQLIRDIKGKQCQALFYIGKMENIAKGSSVKNK